MSKAIENGYSEKQIAHFESEVMKLRNAQPRVQMDLGLLVEQMSVQRAKVYGSQAMGRRLPVIEQTVLNIFDIYPPDRKDFLSKSDCTNIAIQLHAFAINVYAIFDNAAWVCMLEDGEDLSPIKVGLYKKECRKYIPEGLVAYMNQPIIKKWFEDYGKVYRDSTAHRIPPYLPSRNYTSTEAAQWKKIHNESTSLLFEFVSDETHEQINERLEKHHQLESKKNGIGSNSLFVALTLEGEDAEHPVFLHPQLLSDWALVHEFVTTFTISLREKYNWESPNLPEMMVSEI